MTIHKKFPRGTEISGHRKLSIWGDMMALVEAPYWDTDDPSWFDAEAIAHRYDVFLSNLPVDEKLVGEDVDFRIGDRSLYDQPFYYRPYRGAPGPWRGQLEEPFEYWVEVPKFRDLSQQQTSAVVRVLDKKRYVEAPDRYPLSASKWRKLLTMPFEETQDGDHANATYQVIEDAIRFRGAPTPAGDESIWVSIPGVYARTKKGGLKFIISRKANKKGL